MHCLINIFGENPHRRDVNKKCRISATLTQKTQPTQSDWPNTERENFGKILSTNMGGSRLYRPEEGMEC